MSHHQLNRRAFIAQTTIALPIVAHAATNVPLSKMGIASTSFMGAQNAPGQAPRPRDTYAFLEKCHALGAGGIQAGLNGDLNRVRARAEELGMYIEGMVSIPRNGDLAPLEKALADARTAGVQVVRAALLSGRRYESFATLAEWKKWIDQTHLALTQAMPVIEKHKVIVAVENHKDWTLEDFQRLLRTYSSEYLQVCLDFGNNLALLDDPIELIEGLAPFAKSTHIKDMAVQPYPEGFLLSEVPLGAGILDLPKIAAILQKANPNVKFSLEMITRDPLKVPCLDKGYWEVFPDRNGRYLAQIVKLVNERASREPLPTVTGLSAEARTRVEEENVKACLQYFNEKKLGG